MTEDSFGKIRVTGKDRIAVLHNILTQDIKNLSIGQHAPAALLSNTGKVLAFMEVFVFEDFLILVVEKDFVEKTTMLIDKYIISEDVVLEDITGQSFEAEMKRLPEPLRIEAGLLRHGVDMDESTILSETGLEQTAVSSTKGCYPGQEVVARIETYKGLNRKIFGFILEGDSLPKPKSKVIAADKEIGWITSAAHSKNLGKGIALGYLSKGYWEKGLKVKIDSEGNEIQAETAALPFK